MTNFAKIILAIRGQGHRRNFLPDHYLPVQDLQTRGQQALSKIKYSISHSCVSHLQVITRSQQFGRALPNCAAMIGCKPLSVSGHSDQCVIGRGHNPKLHSPLVSRCLSVCNAAKAPQKLVKSAGLQASFAAWVNRVSFDIIN